MRRLLFTTLLLCVFAAARDVDLHGLGIRAYAPSDTSFGPPWGQAGQTVPEADMKLPCEFDAPLKPSRDVSGISEAGPDGVCISTGQASFVMETSAPKFDDDGGLRRCRPIDSHRRFAAAFFAGSLLTVRRGNNKRQFCCVPGVPSQALDDQAKDMGYRFMMCSAHLHTGPLVPEKVKLLSKMDGLLPEIKKQIRDALPADAMVLKLCASLQDGIRSTKLAPGSNFQFLLDQFHAALARARGSGKPADLFLQLLANMRAFPASLMRARFVPDDNAKYDFKMRGGKVEFSDRDDYMKGWDIVLPDENKMAEVANDFYQSIMLFPDLRARYAKVLQAQAQPSIPDSRLSPPQAGNALPAAASKNGAGKSVSLWIASYNLANNEPAPDDLTELLKRGLRSEADVIVFTTQEDVSQTYGALQQPTAVELLKENYTLDPAYGTYINTVTDGTINMMSLTFAVKKGLANNFQFGVSTKRWWTKKGGVGAWLVVNGQKIAVVGTQLAENDHDSTNALIIQLLENLATSMQAAVGGSAAAHANKLDAFDAIFVAGDLNFRMALDRARTWHRVFRDILDGTAHALDTTPFSSLVTKHGFLSLPLSRNALPTYKLNLQKCRKIFAHSKAPHLSVEEAAACYLADGQDLDATMSSAKEDEKPGTGHSVTKPDGKKVPVVEMGWLDRVLYRTKPTVHLSHRKFMVVKATASGSDHLPVVASVSVARSG